MIKTGIVISVVNKKAGIMTSSGEFVYIKISKVLPTIGEIYTGELYKKNVPLYKYAITAASLMFMLLSSVSAYSYYTPVTTVVVNINPSVSLKANRWNKIISSKALNSDGSQILSNIKLKNKSIDDGLELLVKESKTENFINDKYVEDKKIISVDIKTTKNSSIDISNFKNIIDSNNLNIEINAASENNKNIDITANNEKINTFNLKSSNHKKDITNEKSNIKKHNTLEDSSRDSNTDVKGKKTSETKENLKTNTQTTSSGNDNLEDKFPNNNNYSTVKKDHIPNKKSSQDEENKNEKKPNKSNITDNDNNSNKKSKNHSSEIKKK